LIQAIDTFLTVFEIVNEQGGVIPDQTEKTEMQKELLPSGILAKLFTKNISVQVVLVECFLSFGHLHRKHIFTLGWQIRCKNGVIASVNTRIEKFVQHKESFLHQVHVEIGGVDVLTVGDWVLKAVAKLLFRAKQI